jgi:septal ring factor EnvC (AmiA/AmiB activator)
MSRVLALVLVLVILIPLETVAKDDTTRLKELGKKVEAIDIRRRSEEQQVQTIDRNISVMQNEIAAVRTDVRKLNDQIFNHRKQIRYYQAALNGSQGALRQKWISLYKGSSLDMVNMLYSHSEYSRYLDAIITQNKQELAGYRETQGHLLQAKARLDETSRVQKENLKVLEGKIKSLDEERNKKAVLMASLSKEKQSYQEEIQQLIKRIQARGKELANKGMSKKQGDLPWPVKGKIVRGFGISKEEGYAQISHGVDIEAEDGAPVKSVYAGRIVFYNWISTYGNTMIIDHGGGLYSVYGHIQKALKSTGDSVNAQEDVALVGQSGDVLKPTLHFEIRYRDKPQDPYKWLSRK